MYKVLRIQTKQKITSYSIIDKSFYNFFEIIRKQNVHIYYTKMAINYGFLVKYFMLLRTIAFIQLDKSIKRDTSI